MSVFFSPRPRLVIRQGSTRSVARLLALALMVTVLGFVPVGFAAPASASAGGPIVLDGMDPVCHDEAGSATGGYIRAVVSSLHAGASSTNDGSIAVIDPATANSCGSAISSRMSSYLSGITPTPTVAYAGTVTEIDTLFANIASGAAKPAVLWIPDDWSRVGSVDTALTAHASDIADFVNAGGALFSSYNSYGWLTTLLPLAVFHQGGCNGGPEVTAAGNAAFPALTNTIVAACWHGYFTGNTGSLVPLIDYPYPTTTSPRVAVAIGGASVTLPSAVTLVGPAGTVEVGTDQTVTATVKNSGGTAQVGVTVTFTIASGPEAGFSASGVTNASGVATATLHATSPGTDAVTASATVNGSTKTASTTVKWLPMPHTPSLTLTAGNGQVTVASTPDPLDAAAQLTGLFVTVSPGGATATLAAGGGSTVITGLTNGTPYTVQVLARNAIGDSAPATATVTPHLPVGAVDYSADPVAAGGSQTFSLPAATGGTAPFSYAIDTAVPGAAGTAVVSADGSVTFHASQGFSGSTSFTYTVTDGTPVTSSPATVSLTVLPAALPLIVPTGAFGHAQTFSLPAPYGTGPFTYTLVTGPGLDGTVTLDPGTGHAMFIPASGFSGKPLLTYTVTDAAEGVSAPATVQMGVAPALATPAPGHVVAGKTVAVPVTPAQGVGPFVYALVTGPVSAEGTATIDPATGTVTFTAATGFSGTVHLTVSATDAAGLVSPPAAMAIVVTAPSAGTGLPHTGADGVTTLLTDALGVLLLGILAVIVGRRRGRKRA